MKLKERIATVRTLGVLVGIVSIFSLFGSCGNVMTDITTSTRIENPAPSPVFSLPGGVFATPQELSLSSTLAGATIRYTTDGSDPSATNGAVYDSPIAIATTQTVKAIASKTAWLDSVVSRADFTITGTEPSPTFNLSAGTYTTAQSLSISCADPLATIRYTTDDSTPTLTNGQTYTVGISIVVSQTIKAVAIRADWADSAVVSAAYEITGTVAAPTYSLAIGTHQSVQPVSLASTTSGANIYYSVDGSTPSASSTLYAGPISVFQNTTIKAIATRSGWSDSLPSSASYVIHYTLQFDSQGGSDVTSLGALSYGQTATAPGTSPTRTGYTFAGWYKETACTNVWTFVSDVVIANFTLYAKWVPITYTVTFDSQGATVSANPGTKAVTTPATTVGSLPTAPTKVGYSFGGWYTGTNGSGSAFSASTTVTSNFTVYAKWVFVPVVSTFAGSGTAGYENGTGAAASFNNPQTLAIDAAGNLYLADEGNNVIRKITSSGQVSTFAGSGIPGDSDGTGTAASFRIPTGVASDAAGNLYVADQNNHRIRKITPAGVVSTLAGSGAEGSTNGTGTGATFNYPARVSVDTAGNVYVASWGDDLIRKVTSAGVVTTLAGSGVEGSADGTGTAASFTNPHGIVAGSGGIVYVCDSGNRKIRKIDSTGVVTTLAGTGVGGSNDGAGSVATFYYPIGLAIDSAGDLYVTDPPANKVRKVTAGGLVSTIAGTGSEGAVNGPVTVATFNQPQSVIVDSSGNLYVVDRLNIVIRKILMH